MTAAGSAYDALATEFDRQRTLPDIIARSVRNAIVTEADLGERPLVLDVGAGTGRIGWPFVAAEDFYVGLDLSLGMLCQFAGRTGPGSLLVQGDGTALPFASASFDAVILVQVFSGTGDWRRLAAEACRVLRCSGVLVTGQTVAPEDGVDARMKQQLACIVESLGVPPYQRQSGEQARNWLRQSATTTRSLTTGKWTDQRTPRRFVERHQNGARFAALDAEIRQQALDRLQAWALAAFGSLDTMFNETFCFQVQFFRFGKGP
jgi:ubiquinone/menaquinone biosynthesis C-methylase UbiE